MPMILRAVAESGRARARRTSSSTPASNIARVRASIRRVELVRRDVEPDDRRRLAGVAGPEPVAAQRMADLGELERAHDAPPVVRVHGRGRLGVEVGQERVRALGAPRRRRTPALAGAGHGRRRNLELGERGPEVQAGAADHDGRPAGGERASIAACASVWNSATEASWSSGQIPTRAAGDWLVRIGRPR